MTSYLTDHMSAIARKRETTFDPIIITGFKYDMQFVTPAQLQREALRAAQYNLAQTKQFEIIPKEPK